MSSKFAVEGDAVMSNTFRCFIFSQDVMEKARNKVRIRLANIMMLLTAIGCIVMVWSGKEAKERGESVQKSNLDWHKEYNEQSIAQAEAAKAAQKNK